MQSLRALRKYSILPLAQSIQMVVIPSIPVPDLQDSHSSLVVSPALLKLSTVLYLQARCLDPTLPLEELSIRALVCITDPRYILALVCITAPGCILALERILAPAGPWVAQPID